MNRLILIGNGFDLAHGMKTNYMSFLKWYLRKQLHTALSQGVSDELMTIYKKQDYSYNIDTADIDHWIEGLFNKQKELKYFGEPIDYGTVKIYPFNINIRSELLNRLFDAGITKRWVDVESTFYEALIDILDKGEPVNEQEEALRLLNNSLRLIILELTEYLNGLPKPNKIAQYFNIINSPIAVADLESGYLKSIGTQLNPKYNDLEETLILDFNYTSTIEMYFDVLRFSKTKIKYIHGKLNDPNNPLIFGFGDEIDKRYKQLEESKAKGWFNYIKSFRYLKTNNYRELIRFIDSKSYQVLVLGHSCGLSDRTMLQMIFQHINCKSIKLYYYGDKAINNYVETLHEIARHFTNKEAMRRHIVSEESSERMPQYND